MDVSSPVFDVVSVSAVLTHEDPKLWENYSCLNRLLILLKQLRSELRFIERVLTLLLL